VKDRCKVVMEVGRVSGRQKVEEREEPRFEAPPHCLDV